MLGEQASSTTYLKLQESFCLDCGLKFVQCTNLVSFNPLHPKMDGRSPKW